MRVMKEMEKRKIICFRVKMKGDAWEKIMCESCRLMKGLKISERVGREGTVRAGGTRDNQRETG